MKLQGKLDNLLNERKYLDWEDSYEGVKFELYHDDKADTYELWLYLKQAKTKVWKNKKFDSMGPKNTIYDTIDDYKRKKKV